MQDANFAMHDLAKLAATRRHRAAIIDARHEVALLSQHPMPQPVLAVPNIAHRLAVWLTVDVDQQRILFDRGRIEAGWLQAPRIELDVIADIEPQELRRRPLQGGECHAQLLIVDQRSHMFVLRQRDKLHDRPMGERRIRVDREFPIRRNVVRVPTGPMLRRRHPLPFRAVEGCTVEVALRRVIWRSGVVNRPVRFIDRL